MLAGQSFSSSSIIIAGEVWFVNVNFDKEINAKLLFISLTRNKSIKTTERKEIRSTGFLLNFMVNKFKINIYLYPLATNILTAFLFIRFASFNSAN